MKIVIAPNAFKDCLSAAEIAIYIEKGLKKGLKNSQFVKIPLADGGDGTLEVITKNVAAPFRVRYYKEKVTGPLKDSVAASYAMLPDKTAVIELASASGLALLPPNKRNPMKTTTYGTGELIYSAIKKGVKKIIVGVGGSATCDGGAGILTCLGVIFLNKKGKKMIPTGGTLNDIKSIDIAHFLKLPEIIVACDVLNPLLGENGAARVYAPQKGASPKEVKLLEQGLKHFSEIVPKGKKLRQKPGTGASGGAPFGLTLIGAKLAPGAQLVMEIVDFEAQAKDADLIITGEGEVNENTKYGKVVYEVMQFGKRHKIPVIAIVGGIGKGVDEFYKQGLTSIFSITKGPMPLEQSIAQAPQLLQSTAERLGKLLSLLS